MKFINLLILAIVLLLVVSISSKSARKSKSHKKAPKTITMEQFLAKAPSDTPEEKLTSFKLAALTAGASCKKECTIHRNTYYYKNAFYCQCVSSWFHSKHGDTWTKLTSDQETLVTKTLEDNESVILH